MQKLSGSIEHKEEIRLTPFEQAHYNSAKLISGLAAAQHFQDLVARLKFLEGLRDITEDFSEPNKTDFTIKKEILSIESAIVEWCDMYGESNEA